jgi:hypothetical protein
LPGEATTEPSQAEPEGDTLSTVTDVRVGTHDGFDRVTFDIAGGGLPGWFVEYEQDPTSDGSGLPIEVDGAYTLRVVLTGIAIPPDAEAETFLDDVAGPDGGIITEVVNDTVFEGHHTFVVGLDERAPYRIARLDDPTRIVLDLVHDTAPVGGVETGFGGAASGSPLAVPLTVAGAIALAAGAVLLLRRRVPA